jgi:hypothetical protein
MSEDKRKDFSLVVRLWQVESGEEEVIWRGSIERVPGDEGPVYFQTLEAMFKKIVEILEGTEDD